MRTSDSGKPVLAAPRRWPTGRGVGVVALGISSELGERELAKRLAAGWPPLWGKQVPTRGGRLVLLAHPGEPFHVVTRRLAAGLRVYGEGGWLPVEASGCVGGTGGPHVEVELGPMPLWLLRASVRVPSEPLAREIFDAALDYAEAAARSAGLLPFYL